MPFVDSSNVRQLGGFRVPGGDFAPPSNPNATEAMPGNPPDLVTRTNPAPVNTKGPNATKPWWERPRPLGIGRQGYGPRSPLLL